MNRRNILIGFGAVAAGAAAGGAWWMNRAPQPLQGASDAGVMTLAAAEGGEPIYDDDHILGDVNAPVTIIEYASLTCGHCAHFHSETLPEVKANWIESGRARLVYRHYPLDQLALRGAALANCVEGANFFGFVGVLFQNQEKWAFSQDPLTALQQYAALAGIGAEDFEKCITDEAAITRILEKQTDGRDRYSVGSTPSFVVNGKLAVGAMTYDEFNTVLEQAAAKAS